MECTLGHALDFHLANNSVSLDENTLTDATLAGQ